MGMASTPHIDRDALAVAIKSRFPAASIEIEEISLPHGSWLIQVTQDENRVDLAWGPISGFGATNTMNYREDANPFGAYDWPLDSIQAAVDFVAGALREKSS